MQSKMEIKENQKGNQENTKVNNKEMKLKRKRVKQVQEFEQNEVINENEENQNELDNNNNQEKRVKKKDEKYFQKLNKMIEQFDLKIFNYDNINNFIFQNHQNGSENKDQEEKQKHIMAFSNYSYLSNAFIRRISSEDLAQQFACKFPLFQMMKSICKNFLFNELEIIFFANFLQQNKWNIQDIEIKNGAQQFQIQLNMYDTQQAIEYRQVLVYLLFNALLSKQKMNRDDDFVTFQTYLDQIMKYDIFGQYLNWKNNHKFVIDLKQMNTIYRKLSQKPLEGNKKIQEDYNSLVDAILLVSPPYNQNDKCDLMPIQKQPKQPQQESVQIIQPPQKLCNIFGFNNNQLNNTNTTDYSKLPMLKSQNIYSHLNNSLISPMNMNYADKKINSSQKLDSFRNSQNKNIKSSIQQLMNQQNQQLISNQNTSLDNVGPIIDVNTSVQIYRPYNSFHTQSFSNFNNSISGVDNLFMNHDPAQVQQGINKIWYDSQKQNNTNQIKSLININDLNNYNQSLYQSNYSNQQIRKQQQQLQQQMYNNNDKNNIQSNKQPGAFNQVNQAFKVVKSQHHQNNINIPINNHVLFNQINGIINISGFINKQN